MASCAAVTCAAAPISLGRPPSSTFPMADTAAAATVLITGNSDGQTNPSFPFLYSPHESNRRLSPFAPRKIGNFREAKGDNTGQPKLSGMTTHKSRNEGFFKTRGVKMFNFFERIFKATARLRARTETIGCRLIAANERGIGDDEPTTGPGPIDTGTVEAMTDHLRKLCSTPRQPTTDPVSVGAMTGRLRGN